MLTYAFSRLPEFSLNWLIKALRLSEAGIVEYFHELMCPCGVETDLPEWEDEDAAA